MSSAAQHLDLPGEEGNGKDKSSLPCKPAGLRCKQMGAAATASLFGA